MYYSYKNRPLKNKESKNQKNSEAKKNHYLPTAKTKSRNRDQFDEALS